MGPSPSKEATLTLYSSCSTDFWTYTQPKDAKPLTILQTIANWTIEQRNDDAKNHDTTSSDEEDEGDEEIEATKPTKRAKTTPLPHDQTNREEMVKCIKNRRLDGLWIDRFDLSTMESCELLSLKELRLYNIPSETDRICLDGKQLESLRVQGGLEFCMKSVLWVWMKLNCPNLKDFRWSLSAEEVGSMHAGKKWCNDDVLQFASEVLLGRETLEISGVLSFFWSLKHLSTFRELYKKTHISTYATDVFPTEVRTAEPNADVGIAVQVQHACECFLECSKRKDVFCYGQKLPDISLNLYDALDTRLLRRMLSGKDYIDRELLLDGVNANSIQAADCLLKNIRKVHWYHMSESFCVWLCKSMEEASDEERIKELSCAGDNATSKEHKERIRKIAQEKGVVFPAAWRLV